MKLWKIGFIGGWMGALAYTLAAWVGSGITRAVKEAFQPPDTPLGGMS